MVLFSFFFNIGQAYESIKVVSDHLDGSHSLDDYISCFLRRLKCPYKITIVTVLIIIQRPDIMNYTAPPLTGLNCARSFLLNEHAARLAEIM